VGAAAPLTSPQGLSAAGGLCACGCGRPAPARGLYADGAGCRVRAWRQRNAPGVREALRAQLAGRMAAEARAEALRCMQEADRLIAQAQRHTARACRFEAEADGQTSLPLRSDPLLRGVTSGADVTAPPCSVCDSVGPRCRSASGNPLPRRHQTRDA
jgi:hypothetical protein